ncbi:MAG: hypothetical protein LBJ31_09095 [Treponema sp.]|jgi:endonuclease/exonuclease/phosphatase family metal-dependent hydrolase|nr:hypothetical protein [Treponema sp.]
MNKIALTAVIVASALFLFGAGLGIFFLWMNAHEFKPESVESVAITRNSSIAPAFDHPIELYSWNIGYASLDASQDFFMEGGKNVRPSSGSNVEANIWAIQAFLSQNAPDIVFLQEVDRDSKRSYEVDQIGYFSETWKGSSAYTANFRSFIPVPLFRAVGRVESGMLTLNSYGAVSAERIALPYSPEWPERLVMPKQCLLVERVPVQNRELVLVNVHLDYFDEDIKAAQTKLLAGFCKNEAEKGNYVVAGGDFNQPLDKVSGQFGEAWLTAPNSIPTKRRLDRPFTGARDDSAFSVIDGFIVSPTVRLIAVETINLDFQNSDHNPVKLTFSLIGP